MPDIHFALLRRENREACASTRTKAEDGEQYMVCIAGGDYTRKRMEICLTIYGTGIMRRQDPGKRQGSTEETSIKL